MRTRPLLVLALAGAVGTGCGADDTGEPAVSGAQQTIAGGLGDNQFPQTCAIKVILPPDPEDPGAKRDPFSCSCVLVGERMVLTAAHCLEENVVADELGPCTDNGIANDEAEPCVSIRFGDSYSTGAEVAIEQVELSRYFNPDLGGVDDLAMVLIDAAPGVAGAPVTVNTEPLDASNFTGMVTFVGYGEIETGVDTTGGARRAVTGPITAIAARHILAGNQTGTTCRGDGGGPVFYDFGDGPVLVAINSEVGQCDNMPLPTQTVRTRVDQYAADFIFPFIDRFSGPCLVDDTCVTDGCRSPDPDCDDCLQGNVCKEDCPTRDFDCDIGAFPGQACEQSGQCERGGQCVAAADDEAFTYCTQPCDPDAADAGCPNNMTCTDLGGGEGECQFGIPSPGSQGFPCALNAECRSGICEEEICVVTCESDDDCPQEAAGDEPFRCLPSNVSPGDSVCIGKIVTGGGGFCEPSSVAAAGRRPVAAKLGGMTLLFLAAIALVLTGRRRSGFRGADEAGRRPGRCGARTSARRVS